MFVILYRNIVLNILNNVGLVDPHSQLSKELDGWDIWNLEETNHAEELGRMCDDFLEKLVKAGYILQFILAKQMKSAITHC